MKYKIKTLNQYLWLAITIFIFAGMVNWFAHDTKNYMEQLVPVIEAKEVKNETMVEFIVRRFTEEGLSVDKALRVIACESNFRPEIAIIEPNDTISFGLYQINSIHKDISHADKLDYKKATNWTINKVKHDNSWSAWSCAKKLNITGK